MSFLPMDSSYRDMIDVVRETAEKSATHFGSATPASYMCVAARARGVTKRVFRHTFDLRAPHVETARTCTHVSYLRDRGI